MKVKCLVVIMSVLIFFGGCGRAEETDLVTEDIASAAESSDIVERLEQPIAPQLLEDTSMPAPTFTPETLITPAPVMTEPPVIEVIPTLEPVITELPATEPPATDPPPTETPVPEFNQWDMIYVDDDTDMAYVYGLYKIFYEDEAISYNAEDMPILDLEECRAMSIERLEEVYTRYGNILDQYLMWKYYAEMPEDFGKAFAESIYGPLDEDNKYLFRDGQEAYAKAYWESLYTVVTEELQYIYAEKQGLTYWDAGYFSELDGGPYAPLIPIYGCELKNDWNYLLSICGGDEDLALHLCMGASCVFTTVEEFDCYTRRFVVSFDNSFETAYMDLKACGILDWDKYALH